MTRLLLAVKAEVVLGALLVIRHRTPRLMGVLVLVVVASGFLIGSSSRSGAQPPWLVLVVAGCLAATCASRLLAPGAALAAGYRVAAAWWLVPSARLLGALLVIVPLVMCAALLVGYPTQGRVGLSALVAVASLYAAALGSLVLALTPALGASAGAAMGFMAAWFGMLPPSAVSDALERWPILQRVLVWVWNSLPLGWRATHWFDWGANRDLVLLLGWVFGGIAGAAWIATWARRSRNQQPLGAT